MNTPTQMALKELIDAIDSRWDGESEKKRNNAISPRMDDAIVAAREAITLLEAEQTSDKAAEPPQFIQEHATAVWKDFQDFKDAECSGDPTDVANKWHCPKCGVSSQWFDRIAKESAQDTRQRFEAWVIDDKNYIPNMLRRVHDAYSNAGDYEDDCTQSAWAAWQEATRQAQEGK